MDATLDVKLAELKRLEPESQFDRALSIILDSPNGEAPHVFDALGDGVASYRLRSRIDRNSGLMLPLYFIESVKSKVPGNSTYVLFGPQNDVCELKALLKENSVAPTHDIGIYGQNITALLPCSVEDAEELLKDFDAGFASAVDASSLHMLHSTAAVDLQRRVISTLANLRADIALALMNGENGPINQYLVLKDKYNK